VVSAIGRPAYMVNPKRTPYACQEDYCIAPTNRGNVRLVATKQEIREYFAKFGKQGGKSRAKNMTAKERTDAARAAAQARWKAKQKKAEK
jgi:hypothetical protein